MFKNKEYVLTVVKEKSFTVAAQKLFISQPSLSASIKRIEDKIGAPIFDRSRTQYKPSAVLYFGDTVVSKTDNGPL